MEEATMRTLVLLLLALSLAAPAAQALPTPGLFCDAAEATTGRIFPEALQTNDFVSYDEARCGLEVLLAEHPEMMKIDIVGQSVGWSSVSGGHDQFDVFVVRLSNYESAYTHEQKVRLVFQLSIHGNEKGGREGGLRVIEDFVKGIGFTEEHPELLGYLDWMELLFVFPNPDGWTHEEAQYRHNDACYTSVTCIAGVGEPGSPGAETQGFVRVNGNGVDVNREWPTAGWAQKRYTPMSEPEATALVNYLKNETNVKLASDIHGMLNPADGTTVEQCFPQVQEALTGMDATCFQHAVTGARGHFVLTMLPAGRQDPREMVINTALADLVKERLNGDPHFAAWHNAPGSVQGAWGGEFNDWGTVWDTLGYTDSGFTSDWYAQDHGLNAAGVDFELAYNHITVDNYYPGAGQFFNDYHVEAVREIIRAFMDFAAMTTTVHVDTAGTRTAWVTLPTLVTNEGNLSVPDWAADNMNDDAFDAAHNVYRASPNEYFLDLKPKLRDGEAPGVFDELAAADVTADRLADYDNLIVAGSAYDTLTPESTAAIRAWVEAGGRLLVTDHALQLLEALGVVGEGAVESYMAYAGHTNFVDKEHALAQGIRGLARETYEPVPLGFGLDELSAPIWYVKADAFDGEVVGVGGDGQGARPNAALVDYGRATLGQGEVVFLGALLPDPVNAIDVPYKVDSYATTYTGNQLLRNAMGWTEVVSTQAAVPGEPESASLDPAGTPVQSVPGVAPLLLLGILGVAALTMRRR